MAPTRSDQTLAEMVDDAPAAARVFEGFGLDYCCGGKRRLDEACADAGIEPADVVEALGQLEPAAPAVWISMGPEELVDHLEATHHAYLHMELARLDVLADKVTHAHGGRHPELAQIQATVQELRADLEPHLATEERVLFPMIRDLAAATSPPAFPCGSVRNPIAVMLADHDRVGELLARLRLLTGGYQAPPDACGSYQALYSGLAELEADTHLHVHKENNLLFPAVAALEDRWASTNDSPVQSPSVIARIKKG